MSAFHRISINGDRPGVARWIVLGVVIAYVLLFPALYPVFDHVYFIFGLLPIVLGGLLLGLRGAVVTVFAIALAQFGILVGPLDTSATTAAVESFPLVTLIIGATIGHLRDLRQELREQRDELERRNRRLDEFASIVSHDLRNPLNVAVGHLELAREDGSNEHLDAVARSHGRMEALIDDILRLARNGKAVVDPEPIALDQITERCWGSVATGDATLVTRTDRIVRADESRLCQLLENLMRNAVEHGGDDVTVTVGDLDDGFYVEDDGPGVPAAARARVFETGYSTAGTGTGFGLSIVKEIAEAHGWTVRLTDGSDGGARFEITGV